MPAEPANRAKKRSLVYSLFSCCVAPTPEMPQTPRAKDASASASATTTTTTLNPKANRVTQDTRSVDDAKLANQVSIDDKPSNVHETSATGRQGASVAQSSPDVAPPLAPFISSSIDPNILSDTFTDSSSREGRNSAPPSPSHPADATDIREDQIGLPAEKEALEQDEPLTPSSGTVVAAESVEALNARDEPVHWLLPPLHASLSGKKCLVLDLDETLVHSSFKLIQQADFVVPVEIESVYHNVYVIKRPGVDEFMRQMGELFEIVVFTASLAKYADPVLDMLDIHKVVHHRLFRESCFNHMGNYVKDLGQLGRDLKDVMIIDNSPASYVFHPAHAVPISSWFNDIHDTELLDLMPFLKDLTTVHDVSQVLELAL